MKRFYIKNVVALATLLFAMCGGMLVYSQEHQIISFRDLEICVQDEIYDGCDSKTQDSLRCTSTEMYYKLSDRWRRRSGMHDLRLAYQTQNPLIALNSPRIPTLVFPESGRPDHWSIMDPRSEAFYNKETIKKFIHDNPDKCDLLKNKFNSFKGSSGDYERRVGDNGEKQYHSWGIANPLLIAIAARDTYSVKEELMCGDYDEYWFDKAKDLAIATKNVPALQAMLRYKNNKLRPGKLKLESGIGAMRMIGFLNKDDLSGLNRDILNAASNEDDRLFKIFVKESDLDVLTRRIPASAGDTIESNLVKLHRQGKCSKEKLDFYRNQLDIKKHPWKSIDREGGRDCTIL